MIKKYFLSALFIILSVSQMKIKAFDVFPDNFIPNKLDTLSDLVNYVVELINISAINNTNNLQIKSTAALSCIKNIARAIQDSHEIGISQYLRLSTQKRSERIAWDIFSAIKAYAAFSNLKSASCDKESFVDSKKIAKSNQDKKRMDHHQKIKQFFWLTCNTFSPYLILIIRQLIRDKINLINLLCYIDNNDQRINLVGDQYQIEICRLLLNFSENYRRDILYKQLNSKNNYEKNSTV